MYLKDNGLIDLVMIVFGFSVKIRMNFAECVSPLSDMPNQWQTR